MARDGRVDTPVGAFETDIHGSVSVVVRPENVQISLGETPNAVVAGSEFFGHDQLVTLALNEGTRVRAGSAPTHLPVPASRGAGDRRPHLRPGLILLA